MTIKAGTDNLPRPAGRSWKIVYLLLCLVLLALAIYQFYNLFIRFSPWAPDWVGYVGAVQALNHLENPYILENINQYNGVVLPFVYPPHTLYLFWFLQFLFIFQNVWVFYAFLALLVVVSCWLILALDRKPDYLFLAVLVLTGFISLWWNFTRGNKDIFLLFFFAVAFTLLVKEKYWQSSMMMGLTAGFTLFATPFVALYLLIRRPVRERLLWIILSMGVVAALFLIGYCINPAFFLTYMDSLLSSDSMLIQVGGWNAPTPYWLFNDLFKSVTTETILPMLLVSCVYIGLILYATWHYYRNHTTDTLKLYSLGMLSVFMLLPRMMPYNFIILVLPLYFLFRNGSYRMKSLVLAVVSILPLVVWSLPLFSINKDKLPFLLGPYVQAYSLFLIFIIVILQDHLRSCSRDGEPAPAE
ncbi:glycosyltransferase family 87 protein [uncultured Methanoregula sp.]|uniref:glycosyltransferase family 87 protein n=1 Tax=uncultured Methanoregula sp. TaxID=1005933 RepID=UPI002AAA7AB4|nr:glycosyltransferase family 87 protein [uncultured Methanoregula sp.]